MENECNILYLYEFLCQIAVCLLVLLSLHSRGLQSAYASALSFHAFRQIAFALVNLVINFGRFP